MSRQSLQHFGEEVPGRLVVRPVMAEDAAGLGCIGCPAALGGEVGRQQPERSLCPEKSSLRLPPQDIEVAICLHKSRRRCCRRACLVGGQGREAEARKPLRQGRIDRSEEHTSELQSLMRISYAVFCLKKNKTDYTKITD